MHDLIRQRRSIRKFKPDPIPREVLERIMTSAIWAPSSMNRQPWKFCVLTEEMRDRLASLHHQVFERIEDNLRERYGDEGVEKRRSLYMDFAQAPVAVACFSDLRDGEPDRVSTAMACQNLILAATAESVGSLVMQSSRAIKDEIAFLCGVDMKKMEFTLLVLLGYPDEEPEAPERRKGRVAYYASPKDIRT